MSKASIGSDRLALPGLEAATRLVDRIAAGDVQSHAVLMYGPEGAGVERLVGRLIDGWLGTPEKSRTVDTLHVRPSGKSWWIKDAAIAPGKRDDDVPHPPLLEFIRTLPLVAHHRVAWIEHAHRMNAASANALLKTLEEPLPHVRLVLTAPSAGSLLPTVLSRCLAVACGLPDEPTLRAAFPDATEDDLRLSEGAPERLARILENPEPYRELAKFARSLSKRSAAHAIAAADELRVIADRFPAPAESARSSQSEALAALATWLAREPGIDPRWTQAVIETHRRVTGNASAGLALDALLTRMLRRS